MKNLILTLFASLLFATSCTDKNVNGLSSFDDLSTVEDFAPELSIEGNTFKGSFSDDYNTFYFFRKVSSETEKYIPYISHFSEGKWSIPKIIDYFDGKHSYTYQLKIPWKEELVFLTDKKVAKDTSALKTSNYNFWSTKILNQGYGEPEQFSYENLIYNYNSQPSIAEDGTIYFTSDSPDWSKTFSYKMEPTPNGYSKPELFQVINQWRESKDWTVFEFAISPKEDYMVVCIQDKAQGSFSSDLYISYLKDGAWTDPKNLGDEINSAETENFPILTMDGKYLIFTRGFSTFKIAPTALFLTDNHG